MNSLESRSQLATPDRLVTEMDKQFIDAKSFMLTAKTKNGVNLYVIKCVDDKSVHEHTLTFSDTITLYNVFLDY
jgi:hypothetical protein